MRNVGPATTALLLCALTTASPAFAGDGYGKDKKNKGESTAQKEGDGAYGMAAPTKNIVEIASGNEAFSTLVKAVTAAELAEALQGEGPFTVFAPTDEAFAALPEGTLESLLKPENKKQLVEVLTYHVVPQEIMAAGAKEAAKNDTDVKTLQGDTLGFYEEDGKLKVSGANIVQTDIDATNGVIHVIDQVLLPQQKAEAAEKSSN